MSFNEERRAIIAGLLEFRRELGRCGITEGFQWIDGSFVENVENIRNRPPADVDVVTFAKRPESVAGPGTWKRFIFENLHIFDPAMTKQRFKCDAYFVDLDKDSKIIVDDTKYWFGLFSHQRNSSLWKGMLSISLDSDDMEAEKLLK